MAREGATSDRTAVESDALGPGVRHGVDNRERERVSGHWENPSRESSGVGDKEGGPKASGVVEKSRGDHQGVLGGVDSPKGNDIPGVEELPRGCKNSGVTLEGYGIPGVD